MSVRIPAVILALLLAAAAVAADAPAPDEPVPLSPATQAAIAKAARSRAAADAAFIKAVTNADDERNLAIVDATLDESNELDRLQKLAMKAGDPQEAKAIGAVGAVVRGQMFARPMLRAGVVEPKAPAVAWVASTTKTVFLCEAAGAMLPRFDLLKDQLRHAVDPLKPTEAFDVVFLQDTGASPKGYTALSPDLLMATAENKKKLGAFLDAVDAHGANPVAIPALTAAFRLPTKPDVIYLLSDGDFDVEGATAVAAAVDRLNADHKVKVNAVLLTGGESSEEQKSTAEAMQKIAESNGGVLTKVSDDDMQ